MYYDMESFTNYSSYRTRIIIVYGTNLKRLIGMSKGISLLIKPRIKLICEAYSIGKSRRKLSGKVQ